VFDVTVSSNDPDAPQPEGNTMKPTDGGAAVVRIMSSISICLRYHILCICYQYHMLYIMISCLVCVTMEVVTTCILWIA